MMTGREAHRVLNTIPGPQRALVYAAMAAGRPYEAERVLARALRDGELASEVIGALIRKAITGQ